MASLEFCNVSKKFGNVSALNSIDLHIKDGEFMVLLGPTGAGKTTLLRLAAGLDNCSNGQILKDGLPLDNVPPAERDVAFVFQQYSLYPHLSVYDNLAFPLRSNIRKVPENEIKDRIHKIAEILHISHKLENKATKLSGGEMQRVAIGRALVRSPTIYFMDEPLSSLDAKLRADLRVELKRIQQELNATILYVTHDQIEAMTLGDRIGVLKEGELIQVGTPEEIYTEPNSDYVATRLGLPQINFLPRHCFDENEQFLSKSASLIGIRTEHLNLAKGSRNKYQAQVCGIDRLGDQSHLHLDFSGEKLTLLVPPNVSLDRDDVVSFELRDPILFDEQGRRV
ncbi:ABC transporter ATP-binding protein [Vibrio nigripulchritudo]|uniref:ABC transporter ATP-binding protein n=1 Tax=Vibrio nigripulchritudo TaxID=28173 RepID=UPI0024920D6E|nr:ABC transporter ATP-binding protein [Vibrio nigripulchritudo]BDU37947.1 ABC transporter ATP-binding protein [Vibrio nigripulchritudo]BDU43669.1 ABC transporter ATP-binding protein [Vibrio nigripulchritudo]